MIEKRCEGLTLEHDGEQDHEVRCPSVASTVRGDFRLCAECASDSADDVAEVARDAA